MRIVAAALAILFLLGFSSAQVKGASAPHPVWPALGLSINNTAGNTPQHNPEIISTRDSTWIMVWEDDRSGSTNLYAQKIDGTGSRLWNPNGLLVSRSSANQNSARIIEDESGGAMVVWQDYRNGHADIYAQRISFQGALLWGEEGVAVCKAPAGQLSPRLISDGAGGSIICWHDYRSATGEDIYAQRMNREGFPVWNADGIPVCNAPGTQWYSQIAGDGAGGAVIVWTDGRMGSADNNIYGQRVDPSGNLLWEKDGLPICSAPQNQEHPALLESGDGTIVVWNDFRSGNTDIYAQKIDAGGNLLWEKNGVAVAATAFPQENAQLSSDGREGALVVWTDHREEEPAIFMQRITREGKISYEENGRAVARTLSRQENPEIVKLVNPAWVIIWEDYRKEIPLLFAQKINLSGAILWQGEGIPLSTGLQEQEKASAAASPLGEVIVGWQDRRNGNYDIYAQKLSAEGSFLWDEKGMIVCNAAGAVMHQNVNLIENGRGEIILVFEDARSGFFNIYAQKINRNGYLAWGKDGIAVAKINGHQVNPQLISDDAGGAIVLWEDRRTPDRPRICAQRINSAGGKVWAKSVSLTKLACRQSTPVAVPDGAGGAMVFWQDERNPLSLKDLYAQRISGRGELLWNKNGIAVSAENGDQAEIAAVSDGAGGAIVAWTDYRRSERNPDIYAQRIDRSGKLLWKKEGLLVCGAPDVQRSPQLAGDEEGGAVVAWTDKGGGSYDIYAQRVSPSGQLFWLTDGIPLCQIGRTQQNPQPDGKNIWVWEDYRNGNWDIFAGSVSRQGKLLWSEEGISVSSLPLTQYAPQVIGWKGGSAVLAWEDYRSGGQYEIYLQKIEANGQPAWQDHGVLVKSADGARAPRLLSLPEEDAFVVVWEDYTEGGKAIYGQKFIVD